MIGDDRDERLDIKKSQNALPLRSIKCIPVGVAGNVEDDRRYRDERLDVKKSQKTLPLRSIKCIPVVVAGNMEARG
jgi:hypothetical protein